MTGSQPCVLAPGKYSWPVFSPEGPSARELAAQALSSVEGGYDQLAPKFDHTPFRTPDGVLDATVAALGPFGPFGPGLDVCCGTGAGLRVLTSLCQGPVTGVDFSTGMLAQARQAHPGATWVRADVRALPFAGAFGLAVSFGALGHFLPAQRPALFAGVYRALRPGGVFAFPIAAPLPVTSRWYWALAGFDLAMRVRNALWRPPVRHVLPHLPAVRGPGRPGSIRIHRDHGPPDGPGPARGRQPEGPACPRPDRQHTLTAGQSVQAPARPARGWPGRRDGQQNPSLRRQGPQMLIVVQHGHPVLFPDGTEAG